MIKRKGLKTNLCATFKIFVICLRRKYQNKIYYPFIKLLQTKARFVYLHHTPGFLCVSLGLSVSMFCVCVCMREVNSSSRPE